MEKKSKLLLVAIIVALVLWVGLITTGQIMTNMGKKYLQTRELTDKERERQADYLKFQQRILLIVGGVGLVVLAIPTLLTVIGQKINKRKMILAAGIVYIFTIVGIPSAVLCFIAFAKMKKLE